MQLHPETVRSASHRRGRQEIARRADRAALRSGMDASDDALLFEAVIVPHRSLSARGLSVLIGVIALASALLSARFWLIGAWPVTIIAVVEIGLAIFLILLNARRARASELILLSERTLRVIRTDMRGRRSETVLAPTWLTVVLTETPGRVPTLRLAARGQQEEVGASLGEDEKRDLAAALTRALHGWRNPQFDNPQLR
jgi:uncharacterized membrane protein